MNDRNSYFLQYIELSDLQADYRLDGSQQLLCVSTDGEGNRTI